MRRVLSILIVLGVLGGFARAYNSRNVDFQTPQPAAATSADEGDTKMVDLAADVVYPYDLGNDSSVICLVGNFIGHHNGAVITCDSAVRYGDQRLECFGNVLINKNETYIYGDRADYNGATNSAEVYSQLVKVIDGDATLYTYRFRFNTKSNIGEFDDGGVITNGDNLLEADRGFYYADTRDVIGVEAVEIRNETYQMKGDSVIYNIDTDNARFFTHTNIWNDKGEYLYADRGSYDQNEERYIITKNGYILTEIREVWSDSIDYLRNTGYALLRYDIQIDDTEQKVLAFGDRGEYWDEEGNALLTLDPVVISYDAEQGDSLFMRADTIWVHTRSTVRDREEAEAEKIRAAEEAARAAAELERQAAEESMRADSLSAAENIAELPQPEEPESDDMAEVVGEAAPESVEKPAEPTEPSEKIAVEPSDEAVEDKTESVETVSEAPESEYSDDEAAEVSEEDESESETPLSELSKEERKAKLREIAEQERAEKKKVSDAKKKEKAKAKAELLEAIAERRQAKKNIQLDKQARRDSIAAAKIKAHEEQRKQKMLARLTRKGIKLVWADAATLAQTDSITSAETFYWDSVAHARLDSVIDSWRLPDIEDADSVAVDSSLLDTVYRIVRGYRNVRIYRSDFQAVCDSLSSSSLDSVIRLYIEPVMWHQANQITSEQTDVHTKNEQIEFAEFIGKPMMISKLDTLHYNQVAGKTMYSYFRDNEIYRDDVDGNAQTIYYMQDEKTQELQGMMYITSGDMTFYIEGQEITGITYRGNPEYVLYPMDKIPETQEYFLPGFTWQENRRPVQDSVFRRTIRPSVRDEKTALPLPSFPIAERIESYKKRLIEFGRWYDRHEKLTDDVIYWLDMNTDWREQNARDREMRERQSKNRRSTPKAVTDTVSGMPTAVDSVKKREEIVAPMPLSPVLPEKKSVVEPLAESRPSESIPADNLPADSLPASPPRLEIAEPADSTETESIEIPE